MTLDYSNNPFLTLVVSWMPIIVLGLVFASLIRRFDIVLVYFSWFYEFYMSFKFKLSCYGTLGG